MHQNVPQNARNTNIDSCTKIIVKSEEAPEPIRKTLDEWEVDQNRPALKLKADRTPYFVMWRKRTQNAIAHDLDRNPLLEEVKPDRFCYRQAR